MKEQLEIPNKVIDYDWRGNVDYEAYADEANYIQPEKVEKATAKEAKRRDVKIGRIALFSKNDELLA